MMNKLTYSNVTINDDILIMSNDKNIIKIKIKNETEKKKIKKSFDLVNVTELYTYLMSHVDSQHELKLKILDDDGMYFKFGRRKIVLPTRKSDVGSYLLSKIGNTIQSINPNDLISIDVKNSVGHLNEIKKASTLINRNEQDSIVGINDDYVYAYNSDSGMLLFRHIENTGLQIAMPISNNNFLEDSDVLLNKNRNTYYTQVNINEYIEMINEIKMDNVGNNAHRDVSNIRVSKPMVNIHIETDYFQEMFTMMLKKHHACTIFKLKIIISDKKQNVYLINGNDNSFRDITNNIFIETLNTGLEMNKTMSLDRDVRFLNKQEFRDSVSDYSYSIFRYKDLGDLLYRSFTFNDKIYYVFGG